MAAVGAGPRTQRAVAGHRALQLTLLAGVLAVPDGFLVVSAIERASRDGYTVVVPWVPIGVVLVALPLVAGLLSAALSRRPQLARMLRPIQ